MKGQNWEDAVDGAGTLVTSDELIPRSLESIPCFTPKPMLPKHWGSKPDSGSGQSIAGKLCSDGNLSVTRTCLLPPL